MCTTNPRVPAGTSSARSCRSSLVPILPRCCGFSCRSFGDGDTGRAAVLLAAIPRSVEIAQPNFTRKDERRDGSIHTLSRSDRMFINLPMAELRDFKCHAHTGGAICEWSVPNHHTPVREAIECLRVKCQEHPVIR